MRKHNTCAGGGGETRGGCSGGRSPAEVRLRKRSDGGEFPGGWDSRFAAMGEGDDTACFCYVFLSDMLD